MRKFLYVAAFLLPVVVAAAVAYIAAPADWKFSKMHIASSHTPVIPNTLEEAKKMAEERLQYLKKMNQTQWDIERQTILYKHPPARIEDAIARAELRVKDLAQVTPDMWAAERVKILKRSGIN